MESQEVNKALELSIKRKTIPLGIWDSFMPPACSCFFMSLMNSLPIFFLSQSSLLDLTFLTLTCWCRLEFSLWTLWIIMGTIQIKYNKKDYVQDGNTRISYAKSCIRTGICYIEQCYICFPCKTQKTVLNLGVLILMELLLITICLQQSKANRSKVFILLSDK